MVRAILTVLGMERHPGIHRRKPFGFGVCCKIANFQGSNWQCCRGSGRGSGRGDLWQEQIAADTGRLRAIKFCKRLDKTLVIRNLSKKPMSL